MNKKNLPLQYKSIKGVDRYELSIKKLSMKSICQSKKSTFPQLSILVYSAVNLSNLSSKSLREPIGKRQEKRIKAATGLITHHFKLDDGCVYMCCL